MMAGENALNIKENSKASNVQVGKMSTFKRLKTKTENIKTNERTESILFDKFNLFLLSKERTV